MVTLDVDFVRSQFPAFAHPETGRWAHLENAGGSYAAGQVIDTLHHFFVATKVQPYWDFGPSAEAGEAMDRARTRLAATFNASPGEIHFGPSTTMNTYVLAHALRAGMGEGHEVIVTSQDHEANIGAWRRLSATGIKVREWAVDPTTGLLDPADLDELINDRTRVLAVTHASNLAATINPVAELAERVHAAGGLIVVDGVSHAPHDAIDVQALDCDVYLYSSYKTFGPHQGMMYVRRSLLETVENQNHDFNGSTLEYRLVPAGPQHAEIAASAGILDYYDAVHAHHFDHGPDDDVDLMRSVFGLFRAHEAEMMAPMVRLLTSRDGVHLMGALSADPDVRHPTLAFWSERRSSAEISAALTEAMVSCGHGSFYAPRLVRAVGLDPDDGVVRLSMVHYNTADEVARALEVLDAVL